MTGFDPAAVFLLEMSFPNLFEQIDDGGTVFRCKGCRLLFPRVERDAHHERHFNELPRLRAEARKAAAA